MNTAQAPKGPGNKRPFEPSSLFGQPLNMPVAIMLILGALALVTLFAREQATAPATISYDEFVRQVTAGNVASVDISGNTLVGEFRGPAAGESAAGSGRGKSFRTELSAYLGTDLDKLLLEHSVRTNVRQPSDGTGFLLGLYMLVPLLLMAGFWMTLRRARDPLGGGGFPAGDAFSGDRQRRQRSGERDEVRPADGHCLGPKTYGGHSHRPKRSDHKSFSVLRHL
ncbi:MAG: hypothetical protein EBX36_11540 [Planctomycetia bacterium]|nr:hypothetical protein [Planctomycetia bacterium]